MDTTTIAWIMFVCFLFFIAIGAIATLAIILLEKQDELKKFQPIVDIEAERGRLLTEVDKAKKEQKEAHNKLLETLRELSKTIDVLSPLDEELDVQNHGLYEPKYDFVSSERYKGEIDRIRRKQRQLIKDKEAVICSIDWTVEGSKTKGRKMINEQIKLMLRAFNGECDSIILKVKYNNINSIEKRINRLFDAINKLGKSKDCFIEQEYLELKLEELHLAYEYEGMRQSEKEEQRQIRQQIREEQKALREIEQAQEEAEKEEQYYQDALDQARKELTLATDEQQSKLQAKIEELSQALNEAHTGKERALSRAQMTKSGYVYIVSNLGSFGEDIYKIGMTRRLEPMDRVKELGDASVPFPFDVHAMIFSKDAPSLENTLHKAFDPKRVNQVNRRKEFFNVSLTEIVEIVQENHGTVEFTMMAQAEQFRISRGTIPQVESLSEADKNESQAKMEVSIPADTTPRPSKLAKQHFVDALSAINAKKYPQAANHFQFLHGLLQQHNGPASKQLEMCAAQAICLTQAGDKQSAQQAWLKAYKIESNQDKLKQVATNVASQYGLAN